MPACQVLSPRRHAEDAGLTGIGHGPVRSLKAEGLLNRALRQQDWLLQLGWLWSAPESAGASRQHLPRLKPLSAATTWQETVSQDAGDPTGAPSASNTPTLQGMRRVVSSIDLLVSPTHCVFSSHCLSIRLPLMPLFWFSLPPHASVRFCSVALSCPAPVALQCLCLSLSRSLCLCLFLFLCTTLVLMALPWGGLPDASRQEHPAEPPEAEEVLPQRKRRRTSSAATPPAAPKAPAPAAPKAPGPSTSQARKLVYSRTYHAQRKLLLRAGQSPEAAARDAAAAARAAAAAVAGPQ